MKFFDKRCFDETKRKIKIHTAVFCCVAALAAIAFVLCLVFVKEMTRAVAQTVATLSVIAAGCHAVYFFFLTAQYRRVLRICVQAEATISEEITATVVKFDENYTTYRFLPFHAVEVITQNNEQRRLYLIDGKLEENVSYRFFATQNIICEYEERQ